MKVRNLIPVLLVLVGCSEPMPRNLDSLIQEGDREVFTDPETMTLYSGPVFRLDADDSTRVVFRAVLRNGVLHGPYTAYGLYVEDLALRADGDWVVPSGVYEEGEYRDGFREGPFTDFWPSGIIRGEGSYRSGLKNGPYTAWDEGGQLYQRRNFLNGKFHGPYEDYYANGELMNRRNFFNGERDGFHETYWRGGQVGSRCNYVNGEWHGPCERWYENGQLEFRTTYVNNERDGPYESYYENGQLALKGSYSNGDRCGEWFEDGETVTYDPCPSN